MVLSICHQDTSTVHALVGLLAFAVATDSETYRIQGGNVQLVSTAWNLAKRRRAAKQCPPPDDADASIITHASTRISTVVGSIQGFDLYDDAGESAGSYDIVILAVPISASDIDFLIKSHMDETAVLQQMPLGGLEENADVDETGTATASSIDPNHEGYSPLPRRLPASVTRPYVQQVTTIVGRAALQKDYWFRQEGLATQSRHWTPQQIYMTSVGTTNEYNVTGVYQITPSMYKVSSSDYLSLETLRAFFGPEVVIETEHKWDVGPNYQGRGVTTDFLIYDGATGFHGHTKSGALYYPNAFDLVFPTIESNAMGAKAVANLIAQRLEWIDTTKHFSAGDEL
jgi:hypothetical protein